MLQQYGGSVAAPSSAAEGILAAFARAGSIEVEQDNKPLAAAQPEPGYPSTEPGYPSTEPSSILKAFGASEAKATKEVAHADWPVLKKSADDLYFVGRVQHALEAAGFSVGEDGEDLIFWDMTESALLFFQSCNNLAETALVDGATWLKLLGEEALAPPPYKLGEADKVAEMIESGGGGEGEIPASGAQPSAVIDQILAATRFQAPPPAPSAPLPAPPDATNSKKSSAWVGSTGGPGKWPLLRPEDGGRAVHQLHNLLALKGYHVDEDDGKFWYFGQMTSNAVQFFQAGLFLPETGMVDPTTWQALVGDAQFNKGPEVLEGFGGGEYSEDLAEDLNEDRVWLMGEERWSYVDTSHSQNHRKNGGGRAYHS